MQDHEIKLDPDFADFVTPTHDCYEEKKEPAFEMPAIDDLDEHDDDTYDQYVGASVQLSIGDNVQTGKITGRTRGFFGHKTDRHAMERADMYIKVESDTQIRKTMKGWH
jgi:hypothetical protein